MRVYCKNYILEPKELEKGERGIQRICRFDRPAKWLFASKDWAKVKFYRKFTHIFVKHSRRRQFNLVPHSWKDGLNEQVNDISR